MKSMIYILALLAWSGGCTPSSEAPQVQRSITIDSTGLAPVTTDLGFTVTLDAAQVSLDQIVFTRSEMMARRSPLRWIIGTAHAHPGHGEGGSTVGELAGPFAIDWLADDGRLLGEATLLKGAIDAANLRFGVDGVVLTGTATRDGERWPFSAEVTLPDAVEGVPIQGSGDGGIALRLTLTDPFEGDTLFDGINFAALEMAPGQPDHNRLTRALRSHDHYLMEMK